MSSSSTVPAAAAAAAAASTPTPTDVRQLTSSERTRSEKIQQKLSDAITNLHFLASQAGPVDKEEGVKLKLSSTKRDLIQRIASLLGRFHENCADHIFQNIATWLDSLTETDPQLVKTIFLNLCLHGEDAVHYKPKAAKDGNLFAPKWVSFVAPKDKVEGHAVRQLRQLCRELPLGRLPSDSISLPSPLNGVASTSSESSSFDVDSAPPKPPETGTLPYYMKEVIDTCCPSPITASNTRLHGFRGIPPPEEFPIDSMRRVYETLTKKEYGEPQVTLNFANKDSIYLAQLVRSIRSSAVIISKWHEICDHLVPELNEMFLESSIPLPNSLNVASFDDYYMCIVRFNQERDPELRKLARSGNSEASGGDSVTGSSQDGNFISWDSETDDSDSSSQEDADSDSSTSEDNDDSDSELPGEQSSQSPSSSSSGTASTASVAVQNHQQRLSQSPRTVNDSSAPVLPESLQCNDPSVYRIPTDWNLLDSMDPNSANRLPHHLAPAASSLKRPRLVSPQMSGEAQQNKKLKFSDDVDRTRSPFSQNGIAANASIGHVVGTSNDLSPRWAHLSPMSIRDAHKLFDSFFP